MRPLLFILTLCCCFSGAFAATITVSPAGPVRSISQAVQQARPGDRILIKKGVYREGEITIEKAITLEGEDYPVLDGKGNSQLLTVLVKGLPSKACTCETQAAAHSMIWPALKCSTPATPLSRATASRTAFSAFIFPAPTAALFAETNDHAMTFRRRCAPTVFICGSAAACW